MNFYDKVHELVKNFKETEEYKKYIELKKKVKEDLTLKEKIDTFRNKQIDYQKQYINGTPMSESSKEEMQQLYSVIIQSELGAEFFQAEIRLNVLLADMQKIINDGMKDVIEF
ncbi:MAG: YlbF family regulator [Clostridia bacterium]|nr:YlbF family regulator [Clostridia bacterium]